MLTSNANSSQGAVITGCAFSFQGYDCIYNLTLYFIVLLKHQDLAKIFLFPSWRNTGNFGVGENSKQTASTSEVKVRATTVFPKGALEFICLWKNFMEAFYSLISELSMTKKNGKNVLLFIWMQSNCKYYIKGKVKMVVILPEFLGCTDVEK